LVNVPFGDPLIYVDLHDEQRALMLDLGDRSVLPPRKLLRVSQIFVSHTHMDHFAGFDQLLRVVLGRKKHIVLTGGPDGDVLHDEALLRVRARLMARPVNLSGSKLLGQLRGSANGGTAGADRAVTGVVECCTGTASAA
jgi:ribonuclease BN (tRNA processing enzyme)